MFSGRFKRKKGTERSMNTYIMLGIIDGLILILLGCLFLGRKKCIYRQSYDTNFVILMLFGNSATVSDLGNQGLLIVAAVSLITILFSGFFSKGIYSIVNIKNKTTIFILKNILDEKEIAYEEIYDSIELTDYDNKKIDFVESLNHVRINFRDIRKLPIYNEIKDDFIIRVKLDSTTTFPATGVSMLIIGTLLLVASLIVLAVAK